MLFFNDDELIQRLFFIFSIMLSIAELFLLFLLHLV